MSEPDDTIVRLPLLPSPDEMAEMRDHRRRVEDQLTEQTKQAVRGVAECAAAVGSAGAQLDRAVQLARYAGASWTAIGEAVGISRQAATERWGTK